MGHRAEGLRIFTNAIMDPDPRYWDEEFAKTTKFGGIVTPPIYCSYIGRKTLAGVDDPITRAFHENPNSDGIGGVREGGRNEGRCPDADPAEAHPERRQRDRSLQIPDAGRPYLQPGKLPRNQGARHQGWHAMLVVHQTTYTNQDDELLCILRASSIRR